MSVLSCRFRNAALVFAAVTTVGLGATHTSTIAAAEPDSPPAAVAVPDGPAQAWLVADMVSGRILAEKDAYGQHAPASTIKALLAMVVLDQLSPDTAVRATPSSTDVECSCVGLVPGAVYTTRQLLDALLMVSGNDAANLLGEMHTPSRVSAVTPFETPSSELAPTHTRWWAPGRPGRPALSRTAAPTAGRARSGCRGGADPGRNHRRVAG